MAAQCAKGEEICCGACAHQGRTPICPQSSQSGSRQSGPLETDGVIELCGKLLFYKVLSTLAKWAVGETQQTRFDVKL